MGAYLCSPVPMFPVPMFPGTYVPRTYVSMFAKPIFSRTYVPRYLCSPVPMFPGTYVPRTYVPQYLCSPVPMFPDLRLTTVLSKPPRLTFLSLQIVMIIVIFSLVVSLSVRQRPAQFGYMHDRTPARTHACTHARRRALP